ncbi:MAG TPA: deoxyribodipyrimidine photo-lyase [Parvularculaceae bacterium]|nr:deoxyribodipyrimidine photo-lyase [Parvularculaceae bacterium]
MTGRPNVVLLRRDLRLADNPALFAAARCGAPIIPLFVFDEREPFAPRGAGHWQLHNSLESLGKSLSTVGLTLVLRRGPMAQTAFEFAQEAGARGVFWNRRYEAGEIAADKGLKAQLSAAGIEPESFSGSLLREPWELKTGSGGPYKLFTPFWRALKKAGPARSPVPAPENAAPPSRMPPSEQLTEWGLLPRRPDWASEFADSWAPGESGAEAALIRFLDEAAENYPEGRDRPSNVGTSRLSPHLAFGEISALTIWNAVHARLAAGAISETAADKFLSELAWRDFNYTLLYYNPEISEKPIIPKFASIPWRRDKDAFNAWTKGMTGYPIVDAGMRELWRTGWVHNRVRMIAASFLVKDLLIDWREGERWFRDTLLDADAANNPANWQWVAGCGADASPWIRIFNPVTQGERFDPDGDYVRRFVPELANVPSRFIHRPWEAPGEVLAKAGVTLGADYPNPLVDHAEARRRALRIFD